MLETIQRKAAWWTLQGHRRTSSISDMLTTLDWPSLHNRCKKAWLTKFYKCHHTHSHWLKTKPRQEAEVFFKSAFSPLSGISGLLVDPTFLWSSLVLLPGPIAFLSSFFCHWPIHLPMGHCFPFFLFCCCWPLHKLQWCNLQYDEGDCFMEDEDKYISSQMPWQNVVTHDIQKRKKSQLIITK